MKKNKAMRFASVLLVLTLLSTCVIGGIFAKYVTTGNGSDSARVAKFGVTVTANGDAFKKTYAAHDTGFTLEGNTVVSTADVVAPGTSGEMTAVSLSGTPEVAVRVTYELTKLDLTNWIVGSDFYCPIVITVNGTAIDGLDYTSADAFSAAVKSAIEGYSKDYAAGTDLADQSADSLDVSWAWPFTTTGNDTNDTALGNAATAAEIDLSVKTTVTQID